MSDQQDPPPKKVSSLRDRIAAFEKAGAGGAAPAPAPAPRPKPAGFASWKPRPPSPSSPGQAEASQSASSKPSAGLSASDAKDSIVKGGSLKDRMAALQGKGAFGGPPPIAPKPVLEKPKWKPPPVVAAPPDDDDDDDDPPREERDLADIIKSPPPPAVSTEGKVGGEDAEKAPVAAEGEEMAEADPEEEERQRRAAIAARMARLGGTRVGMAPPVFGKRPPPPPKKRSSVIEDVARSESSKDSATSPKLLEAGEPEVLETSIVSSPPSETITEGAAPGDRPSRRLSEAASLISMESAESHASRNPPASMPVPTVPRRAGPPRKKPSKPTAPPPPEPEVKQETPSTSIEVSSSGHPEAISVKAEVIEDQAMATPPQSNIESVALEGQGEKVKDAEVSSVALGVALPEVTHSAPKPEDEVSLVSIPVRDGPRTVEAEADGATNAEVEIDEESRRRKVAEVIATMGGINPLAASSLSKDGDGPSSPPAVSQESISPESPKKHDSHPSAIEEDILEESDIASPPPPARQSAKFRPPSPSVAEPQAFQQKEIDLGKEENEDDEDSEYSDEEEVDSGSVEHANLTTNLRGQQGREHAVEDQDDEPSYSNSVPAILVPPPRVPHSAEVPHRSVPPSPEAEEADESDSEEEYEDMARSQILVPPTHHRQHGPEDLTDNATDLDGGAPLPVRHGAPRSDFNSETGQHTSSIGQGNGSKGSCEGYDEEEPVRSPNALPRVQTPPPAPPPPAAPPPPGARPTAPHHQPPPVTRAPPPNRGLARPEEAIASTIHASTSQSSLKVPAPMEILDDDEGDPIDPSFHSPSRRASAILSPSTPITPHNEGSPPQELSRHEISPEQEDEALRRRTIAERMAKLGGIKFGAAPPVPSHAPPAHQQKEEVEQLVEEAMDAMEEEEERARKARIAAKMAGMGGMRIGMMPTTFPPRKSHALTEQATVTPPPAPARPPPPPTALESDSDDGVKVEAEESEIEEVYREEVEEAVPPPPVPSRAARPARRESSDFTSSPSPLSSPPRRPPVPAGLPARRPSTRTIDSQRRTSGDSGFSQASARRKSSVPKQHSEYVMVEEPDSFEGQEAAPLPPHRRSGRTSLPPPTRFPPPPADTQDSISSQWELPVIPTSTLEFGTDDISMSWTAVPPEDALTPSASSAPARGSRSASEVQLSSDDLIALWGRVGVQVCEVATTLFERSKKSLVGDGTFPGYIHAVIDEVPNAFLTDDWGYLVYKQLGPSVQKRASDIMPGDLVELHDAKFKGHKGIQAYHQNVGVEEPVIGVVSEFEPKKSKMRVFHANQHVGQQTVESISYRLEDLKSGTIKVYRVLEA